MSKDYDKYVDAKGLKCPQPLLLLKAAIKDLKNNQIIVLEATDPHTDLDLEVWCERFSHAITHVKKKGDVYQFWIKKAGDSKNSTMIKDVKQMQKILISLLKKHIGTLKITSDTVQKFEVCGTIEAMQGKKKVDGFYFASVVPKPKDVRLYFFPIYTHKDQLGELPENLKKCLKGKSCFHIKQMDKDLEQNIEQMISKSILIYRQDKLL